MGRAALLKRVGYYPNPHERGVVRIAKHGAEFVVARGDLGLRRDSIGRGRSRGCFRGWLECRRTFPATLSGIAGTFCTGTKCP